jgi:hypothetical protein
MPATRPRRCNDCDEKFDVLCFDKRGTYIHMDTMVKTDEPTCSCGSTNLTDMVSAAKPIFTGDVAGYSSTFPYFDRSLNCWVHNYQHHERLKKERGLVNISKEDIQEQQRAISAKNRRIEKFQKEEDEKIRSHPGYREFREQVDKGALTDHLKGKQKEAADKQLRSMIKEAS